ncbi:hypothetical protein HMPREF3122_01990 [Corynebacterium sp. HMSC11H10]|nr:hypothetical protein HMPREF2860_09145 [Corynebacterium sp. HMSC064E10]OFU57110.1 hypothetical protein HMPREF3122_01990 [Corynebacterium sp. HMSC11H10]OHR33788.1 hypothetical protein HMPREF3042_03020 [Corynebacterium sp. HMSC074C05]
MVVGMTEVGTSQGRSDTKRRVVDRGIGHRVVEFEVLGDGLVVVTDVDAQHRATEGVESLLDKLQVIDFRPARCTPLAPSVEDDDLAFKIRQADLLTFLHQRRAGEARQRRTFLLCVDNLGLASW